MKFGLQLSGGGPSEGSRLRYYSDILDRLPPDFSTIWVNDHLQFGDEVQSEGWTLLAFLAGAHPRFHYGHLVLCQGFRNPGLLGKMAATLHELTEGKFILGLGAGWHEEEYRAYGYDFPRASIRLAQLAETITLLRALWSDSPATFHGTHYAIERAYCEPRPERAIPILVGAGRPKGINLAANLADMWNWDGPLETYRAPLALLRAECASIGRPMSDLVLTAGIEVSLPEDVRTYAPWVDLPSGDRLFRVGPTASDAVREIRKLEQAGVTHIQVAFDAVESLDRFLVEVAPVVRE